MTRTFPDWVYLTDSSGVHWYHLSKGTRVPLEGDNSERPPARAVYAIPSRDLVSHPQWISSKEPEIITQVVSAETEKLGVKSSDGPGRVSDWRAVQHNGTRTLVQSLSIPWEFELPSDRSTQFTDFVPQYSFFPPARNAAVLWKESDDWVAGYSRESEWAHIQLLGNLTAQEIAGEMQLTLMELHAKGVTHPIKQAVVWGDYDIDLHEVLQKQAGLEVSFEPFPAPQSEKASGWEFEPHEVSAEKLRKAKQRKTALLGVLGLVLVLCLAAAAMFHLWTLEKSNTMLTSRIEQNREAADRVRAAREKWEVLSPAIDPGRSPIELFYQVSQLLPEKGVRITSFNIEDHRTITISGETSSMGGGLKLNADLKDAQGLSDFEWEDFQPRQKGDILEFTAIGKYRYAE